VPEEKRSALPLYYLAYFASLQDKADAARDYLKQAEATYQDYEFPSRPETLEILRYAVRENPRDGFAHLHLGNLYAHLGRPDEAVDHWRQATRWNISLSVAYRNLGLYAWAAEQDLREAELQYRKAIAVRSEDQTLYRDLAEILLAQGKRDEAIELLEEMPFESMRRAEIIIMLAQAYRDAQRYTEAIDLLESTPYFVNWEGQTITWDLFHRAHIARGKQRFERKDFEGALEDFAAALTYPENIGVGRSNKPQEATAQYWRGKALQALDRLSEARSAWQLGAAGVEGSKAQNEARELCRTALQGAEK
jgi:tetratricopeptide (TPR) repeat protein